MKPGTLLELEQYNPDSVITTVVKGVLCASYHSIFVVIVWSLNHVQQFATPWTIAHKARLSIGFARQEYWSGLSFPSPGDLLNPGIEPKSPTLAGKFFTTEPPWNP